MFWRRISNHIAQNDAISRPCLYSYVHGCIWFHRKLWVVKKTNISSNWRYFHLRLFLIFGHNDTRWITLFGITLSSHERHGVWPHRHHGCLFNSFFSLTTKLYQEPHYGRIVLISYAWITGLIASTASHPGDIWRHPESPGWHNESWTLSRPDDLDIESISSGWLLTNALFHPDGIRSYPMPSGW